jgi:hypothetical protein
MTRENPTNWGRKSAVYEEEGARDRGGIPQEILEIMLPALQIGGLTGKIH